MDDRTTGESPHELLLALAGRIDDDLLAWCRELVAVGEDARASELITATLIADRTVLPATLRAALVRATRAARTGLDADSALAPAADEHGTAHLFSTDLAGAEDLAAAVGALPARQIAGCRSWATLRATPAGTAPGPLPQAVVLVEVPAGDTRPVDIMAYQLAITCARTGVSAAVEVVVAGQELPAYHQAALRHAIAVHGADTAAAEPAPTPAPVAEAAPELLSPGSLQPLLSVQDTGPVGPVSGTAPAAPTPGPLPRRRDRQVDDEAGAAFRAASAQPTSAQPTSAQAPAQSPAVPVAGAASSSGGSTFPESPSAESPSAPVADSPADPHHDTAHHDTAGDDTARADAVGADAVGADAVGADAAGESLFDDRPTDPGRGEATPPGPVRRPRPVTALRGLTPAAPRPTPEHTTHEPPAPEHRSERPSPDHASGVTPMDRPQGPRPQPVPSPGRRANLSPVGEPAAMWALPTPTDTPAFASIGDPLDDRSAPLGEDGPTIDENDPLGLGPTTVPPEGPGPVEPPESDSWLDDWVSGDWAMSRSTADELRGVSDPTERPDPSAPIADPAAAVHPAGPRPTPRPDPDSMSTRAGRRRAGVLRQPSPVPEAPDEWEPADRGSARLEVVDARPADNRPGDAGPADPRPADPGPGAKGPGDTGPAATGPGDTGPAATGPGDTGPDDPGRTSDTGPADVWPAHLGPVDTDQAASGADARWADGLWGAHWSAPSDDVTRDDRYRPTAPDRPAPDRGDGVPPEPEPEPEPAGHLLRPESVARLSEADRELLARLQVELEETSRPRTTRRAGIAGAHGASAGGGPSTPPDRAG